eukprot:91523-Rhodomonas_salina.1
MAGCMLPGRRVCESKQGLPFKGWFKLRWTVTAHAVMTGCGLALGALTTIWASGLTYYFKLAQPETQAQPEPEAHSDLERWSRLRLRASGAFAGHRRRLQSGSLWT